MRSVIKMGIALLCAALFFGISSTRQAQAAAVHNQRPAVCGIAQPYGQASSRVFYLFDAPTNYSYGYQLTLALWKDRCPLAFGMATVQSFDSAAPAGKLSVSVFDCDTKLGGYTQSVTTAAGAGIATVASKNVPIGHYYFVQVTYQTASGKSVAFQTGACIPAP
jgi:hypothetical protein